MVTLELLKGIESFIEENKHLGFPTRREFIRDAARWRLKLFRENTEYVEIPKDKYEKLKTAIEEMNTPYHSASDFIDKQVDEVMEKYDAWLQEKEEHEKRQRKK